MYHDLCDHGSFDSDPDHPKRKQPTDVTMVTFGGLVKRNNIVWWNFGFDF